MDNVQYERLVELTEYSHLRVEQGSVLNHVKITRRGTKPEFDTLGEGISHPRLTSNDE